MKPVFNEPEIRKIETKEDAFYSTFLDKAILYADKKFDGVQFKALVAAAGVVARQKQSRSAMYMLAYQIERDTAKGVFIDESMKRKRIEAKSKPPS